MFSPFGKMSRQSQFREGFFSGAPCDSIPRMVHGLVDQFAEAETLSLPTIQPSDSRPGDCSVLGAGYSVVPVPRRYVYHPS